MKKLIVLALIISWSMIHASHRSTVTTPEYQESLTIIACHATEPIISHIKNKDLTALKTELLHQNKLDVFSRSSIEVVFTFKTTKEILYELSKRARDKNNDKFLKPYAHFFVDDSVLKKAKTMQPQKSIIKNSIDLEERKQRSDIWNETHWWNNGSIEYNSITNEVESTIDLFSYKKEKSKQS